MNYIYAELLYDHAFPMYFIHVLDTALLFLRCGEISIDRLLLAIIHTEYFPDRESVMRKILASCFSLLQNL